MIDTVEKYNEAKRRFDKVVKSRGERAMAVCRAAGLEYCQLHNALVDLGYGKPWREVNYSLARKAKRMFEAQWAGRDVLDRMWDRVCRSQFGYRGH